MSEPLEQAPNAPAPQSTPLAGRPPAVAAAPDPRRKSVLLAVLLSGMPGLGQVYVGYYQRGFVHSLVVGVLLSLLTEDALGPLTALASIFLAFFWLYNVIDAGRRAALYNYALAGGADIELPDDFAVPSFRGTVAGGVTLMAVGLVLLGNTAFGVSLAWIEQWWPAVFVIAGAYLAWKANQGRIAAGRDPFADESPDD